MEVSVGDRTVRVRANDIVHRDYNGSMGEFLFFSPLMRTTVLSAMGKGNTFGEKKRTWLERVL
jgi:hypothetical protein